MHPDDAIARRLGLADRGKTECWRLLADGGSVYQGTRPGIDRPAFERALGDGTVAATLNRYEARAGDFFFLEARTVHALGKGCLLYEIQQTSNLTFRVHDWGRVGLDGKPRPLHVAESLETIDFPRAGFGPRQPPWADHPQGGSVRLLSDNRFFRLEERQGNRWPTRPAAAARSSCASRGPAPGHRRGHRGVAHHDERPGPRRRRRLALRFGVGRHPAGGRAAVLVSFFGNPERVPGSRSRGVSASCGTSCGPCARPCACAFP